MILRSHTQLGCHFEPRSWDLQSTKIVCLRGNSYLIGLSTNPLEEFLTNSLDNPLVSGSAMLSLDLTYSMDIIPCESCCRTVLCRRRMCQDLPLYI